MALIIITTTTTNTKIKTTIIIIIKIFLNLFMQPRHFVLTKVMH
jgi:hypothetical protein